MDKVWKNKLFQIWGRIAVGIIGSLILAKIVDWYMCTYACIPEPHRNWILFALIFLVNFLFALVGWNRLENQETYYEDYKGTLDTINSLYLAFLILVSQFNLLGSKAEMIFSFILLMIFSQLLGLHWLDFKNKKSKQ